MIKYIFGIIKKQFLGIELNIIDSTDFRLGGMLKAHQFETKNQIDIALMKSLMQMRVNEAMSEDNKKIIKSYLKR